ncbi:hypothetical protein [Nostoc sp.]|uniref:hypothetical protein n=1 Tax=Nostoc sp. TaxID=1180 RepID=UPI002FF9EFB1
MRQMRQMRGRRINNQCPMPHAPCPMPNTQCPMPNTQCPMPNTQYPNPYTFWRDGNGNY